MWTNPRYRELTGREPPGRGQATAEPPRPSGTLLASFPRKSREGPEAELRVVLDEFQGSPYLALRVWQKDQAGNWWPVKGKGVSIRLSEAGGVADALREALGRANQLINAAEVVENLLPIGNSPATESQARPLAPLSPEQQREAPPRRRQRPEGRPRWDEHGRTPPPTREFDEFR